MTQVIVAINGQWFERVEAGPQPSCNMCALNDDGAMCKLVNNVDESIASRIPKGTRGRVLCEAGDHEVDNFEDPLFAYVFRRVE